MLYNIKRICFILSVLLLVGCVNESNIDNQNKKISSTDISFTAKDVYKKILNYISKDLDAADEEFIKLKTDYENSKYLSKAALALAIAHMNKKEHILANFYLQELMQADSSNSVGKYLLSKNQFMYAKLTQSDQEYMNNAIKSLEVNKNILSDSEYQLLANTMLLRLKLDKVWNNVKIGSMYKKLNKDKAYELYINRTLNLGVDINSIYKP